MTVKQVAMTGEGFGKLLREQVQDRELLTRLLDGFDKVLRAIIP